MSKILTLQEMFCTHLWVPLNTILRQARLEGFNMTEQYIFYKRQEQTFLPLRGRTKYHHVDIKRVKNTMAKILILETIWLIENSAVNKIHCYFLPSLVHLRFGENLVGIVIEYSLSLSLFDSLYLPFLASLSLSLFL